MATRPSDRRSLVDDRAAIGGGLLGADLVAAYFVGVALIGAGLAALAVNLVWSQIGHDPHPAVVIVCAIIGALGALALQRYVIIVGSAFGGAWTAIVGGLAMRLSSSKTVDEVWLAYPASLDAPRTWIIAAWIALGIAGVIVQFKWTAKGKGGGKKKSAVNKDK
jgi:hypothetical protein